jgi:membrane protein insertase Oxa1/YidC/SpoIIIJ
LSRSRTHLGFGYRRHTYLLHRSSTSPRSYTVARYLPAFSPLFLVSMNEHLLELAHQSFGLPWWATIITVTVGLRTVITLPLALRQLRLTARLLELRPTLKAWEAALHQRAARTIGVSGATADETRVSVARFVSVCPLMDNL